MKGFIVINAYPNGEKFIRQAQRIAEELGKIGVEVDVLRNSEVYCVLREDGNASICLPKKYDFCVYLDKDKYLGYAMEESGIRLFNSAKSIQTCDDKVATYMALKSGGIPLIKTIPAPLCYTPNAKPDKRFLQSVAKELGFPLVAKKSYGSFGEGVKLAKDMQGLQKIAAEFIYQPHCFQEYIQQSCGRDIRVIVVGGKAVAAMERVAKEGEFRSNIELGGIGKKISPSVEYLSVAEKAAKILGLDYCGVDLLQTEQGPILCEVNSNAFFEGLERATGENIAQKYALHIANMIK